MNLPKVTDLDVSGKRVLVRADLDVPLGREKEADKEKGDHWVVASDDRLQLIVPTLEWLLARRAKVVVCGHLGRPGRMEDGAVVIDQAARERLSLRPVGERLRQLLSVSEYSFGELTSGESLGEVVGRLPGGGMLLLENLRLDPGEYFGEVKEEEKRRLAEDLAKVADLYVNESFAESHREVASIVEAPHQFKSKSKKAADRVCGVGLRFAREVEVLSEVLAAPKRPLVVVVGGAKIESKLPVISKMETFADRVLVGGKLCSEVAAQALTFSDKVWVASLAKEARDIDGPSAERFGQEIGRAGTVVWSGPMGMFETEGNEEGTFRVASAIASSSALKIAGGGDTELAIHRFGLAEKFDWISVGGGAMLEFLAKGTLPGIEAIIR